MASRFLLADRFRLEILMDLIDRYWRGDTTLAGEIRLQAECFGLSTIARRRLEWEVRDRPDQVEAEAAPRKRPRSIDLRKVLEGDFEK